MAIQTYYFYEPGSIDGIPGSFSAGTAVDINTSTMTVVATRPIGSTAPTIVQLISAQATASTSATLQNAATSTGIGTALSLLGMGSVAFTISGTFSATITWEGSEDGTNFSAMLATPYGSSTPATTTTATGVFIAGCAGLQQVRAHITSYTSGSVTVTAHAVPLSGGSGSGGGGGGGAVTIADGASVTLGTMTDSAWSGSGSGTEIAILKKLVAELAATLGVQQTDLSSTGTISAAQPVINTPVSNATVTLAIGQGQSTWKAQLLAGGGGFTSATTIVADKSPDGGTTWYSASFKVSGASPNTPVSSVVGPGPLELTGNVAGVTNVRVRCSVLNSTETIAITLRASVGVAEIGVLSPLPVGSNTIGGVKLIDTGGTNVAVISAGGAIKVDNSGVTQPVSGTITANVGTTNGLALDTSVNGVIVAQGSTTSGEKGPLVQGAVTTGSPSYTTAQTSPISLTTAGAVRVDASATTQPISGTITSNAGTNLNTSLLALETGGNLASAKTDLDNIKTYTSAFADSSPATGTVTNDGDVVSLSLPGGQATVLANILIGTLSGTLLFEASPDSGTTWVSVSGAQAGTSSIATSTTTAGAWRVGVAGFTNFRIRLHPTTSGTSGTITVRATQGTHNVAVVNTSALGQTTMANSAPVAIASDQSAVKTKGDFLEVAGNAAGSVTGTSTPLISAIDVSGYKWLALQITGTWTMSLQFQCSNDNANWVATSLQVADATSGTNQQNHASTNNTFHGPVAFRYFRVMPTSWSSNASCVATLELYTSPSAPTLTGVGASQSGTWTVQPGNTPNTLPWLVTQTNNNASVPTGAGNTVVKASAGAIGNVVVTTTGSGTGNVIIYDNASTNSGTQLFAFPATISAGQTYQFNGWVKNGITAANVASGPVFTVYYA